MTSRGEKKQEAFNWDGDESQIKLLSFEEEPKLLHILPLPLCWFDMKAKEVCCDILLPLLLYCKQVLLLLLRLFIIIWEAGDGAKLDEVPEADEASCSIKLCSDDELSMGALLGPTFWPKPSELFDRNCCCSCCRCCCWNGELADRCNTGKSEGSSGENDSTFFHFKISLTKKNTNCKMCKKLFTRLRVGLELVLRPRNCRIQQIAVHILVWAVKVEQIGGPFIHE